MCSNKQMGRGRGGERRKKPKAHFVEIFCTKHTIIPVRFLRVASFISSANTYKFEIKSTSSRQPAGTGRRVFCALRNIKAINNLSAHSFGWVCRKALVKWKRKAKKKKNQNFQDKKRPFIMMLARGRTEDNLGKV